MITNLRYHIDGENILVRWNYEDIDTRTVRSTCRLIKRLREEEVVEECAHINWNAYHQNGGGCTFKMPDFPVKVVVYQERRNHDVDKLSINIVESPRYHISSEVKLQPVQKTMVRRVWGGLRQMTEKSWDCVSMECKLTFTGLTADEVESLPGWLVRGTYTHPNGNMSETFFWPEEFHREEDKNVFRLTNLPLPLSEEERKSENVPTNLGKVKFDIPPEVADTEYADMFLMDTDDEPSQSREVDIRTIRLDRVRPKHGKYYLVTCPFCLGSFEPHTALFRAVSASGDGGYQAEPDEEYNRHWKKHSKGGGLYSNKMGHVLDWGSEIASYALAGDPKTLIDVGEPPREGVVITVVDRMGHESHEKICPHCHNRIPVYSGYYPSLFIGMMGYTGSGKTVYMQTMIHLLSQHRLLPGYKLLCTANENAASKKYVDRYAAWAGLSGENDARDANGQGPALNGGVAKSVGGMQLDGIDAIGGGAGEGGTLAGGSIGAPVAGLRLGGEMSAPIGGVTLGGDLGAPLGGATLGGDLGAPIGGAALGGDLGASLGGVTLGGDLGASLGGVTLGTAQIGAGPSGVGPGEAPAARPETKEEAERRNAQELSDYFEALTRQHSGEGIERRLQTLPDATPVDFIEPCIYQLSSADWGKGLILCFYDFPGEAIDLNRPLSQDYQQAFQEQMKCFNGMIFLLDPMMLECTRGLDDAQRHQFAQFTYQAQNEASMAQMLEKRPDDILEFFQGRFTPVGQLSTPMVFAISKSDAIRDHIPNMESRNLSFMDESANGSKSNHVGIDLEEIERNSEEILRFQGDAHLEQRVRAISSNYIWMCVSATGIAPKDGSMLGRYGNPVRVMEPLEWILYQNQCETERLEGARA